MDKTSACGADNPGSIPGESAINNPHLEGAPTFEV